MVLICMVIQASYDQMLQLLMEDGVGNFDEYVTIALVIWCYITRSRYDATRLYHCIILFTIATFNLGNQL